MSYWFCVSVLYGKLGTRKFCQRGKGGNDEEVSNGIQGKIYFS